MLYFLKARFEEKKERGKTQQSVFWKSQTSLHLNN